MLSTIRKIDHPSLEGFHQFVSSDGMRFRNMYKANRHEHYLHIRTMFPEFAFIEKRQYGDKDYHLSRHLVLRRGVYHVEVNDEDDLETLNWFFRGIGTELWKQIENGLPFSFDLEIYYEPMPDVIIDQAQWRIFNDENY